MTTHWIAASGRSKPRVIAGKATLTAVSSGTVAAPRATRRRLARRRAVMGHAPGGVPCACRRAPGKGSAACGLRLGPAVAQAHGAVEDEPVRRRLRVDAEVPLALELHRLGRIGHG